MRLISIACLIALLTCGKPALALAEPVKVAVTIKPVHSLVAAVMKGVAEPELIMKTGASPHHYTLRPSERRALAEASLVFWVGPALESFMTRLLSSLGSNVTKVPLIEADGLLRLPARTAHDHGDAHAHTDPHIWLSASNAHAMADAIADALIQRHATHAQIFESNRQALHDRIRVTDQQISRRLAGKTGAFLSYHDAYQYFEHAYGLNNAGFVSSSEELSPGARKLRALRDRIRQENIRCLFYEAPERPAVVDTLISGLAIDAHEIDAIGTGFEAGENAWFEIMYGIMAAGEACL